MRRTFTIFAALMFFVVNVFAQPIAYDWATTAGGTSPDFGDGVAVDPAGNAFITGTFRYSMNLLGTEFDPVSEQNTMYLAKVSPEQELLWAVTAEADGVTGAGGFKTQYHDGYVYLMGDFRGDATFFSTDFSETTMSSTTRAMFIAKYTDNGLLEWVKKMESSHAAGIIPIGTRNNFVVDDAGAVYLTTQFRTDIDIDGTLVDPEGSGGTNFHAIIVKFDALGAYQWHWNSTHPGDDRGEGLAVAPNGNIMFAVTYASSLTVNEVLYENDNGGIALIEVEADGSYVWDHHIYTSNTNRAFLWDIEFDDDHNIFIGGAHRTTLEWDEDNIFEPENALRTTAFVIKLDDEKDILWTKFFGDPDENTSARAVKIAESGHVFVAGEHSGEMELNDDITVTSAGGIDIFYGVMDPETGDFVEGGAFGGESNELFGMMAVSQHGDIYFIGRFLNEFIIEDDAFESEGSFDMFFAKFIDMFEDETDPFGYVIFSEDFDDGNAADRWTFSEIGGTNIVDFAFDYEDAGIPNAPDGGEGTGLKIAVNISSDDASTSALIAFPNDQHFEGEYRIAFDLWMNLEVGSGGTTEHVIFGGGHSSTAIQMPWAGTGSVDGTPGTGPSDNGVNFAMTCDNGAARDVRAYDNGDELLGEDGGFADPAMQSTQWAPYNQAYEGDIPGNQWLQITIDVLEDRTIFKVNDHIWAETMVAAEPGNIMLGYMDFWASVANEHSYLVYDNLKVWGEEPEDDPPLPPADPINMISLLDKTGANLPPEIGSGGNARGAAIYMDRYVVVPSREGGPNVWVWDSENPDDDPIALDMGEDVIVPLTFPINYARTAGDAIYVSNLSLNPAGDGWAQGVFQIYRWNDLDSGPEVVVSFDALPGRVGDAFSIVGDPKGDGHIIAHINTTKEFRVWTFEDGVLINEDTPDLITLDIDPAHINNHGVYNEIPGEDDLFLVTSNDIGLMLADLEGQVHAYWGTDMIDQRSYDPNIFYYDGKRYLTYTINNEGNPAVGALYQLVDISIGTTVMDAFAAITTSNELADRIVYSKSLGAGHPNLTAVNDVGYDDDGIPMVLAHVVGRGFLLESLDPDPQDIFALTLLVNPENAGTVAGAGNYSAGATVSVSANPAAGYGFENWTDSDGTIISTEASFEFTMPAEDVTLTANFIDIPGPFDVTFTLVDEEDVDIETAVITLGDQTNPEGNYVFTVMPGTYNYSIVAEGYDPTTGSVDVVDEDVHIHVVLIAEEELPPADPIELITLMDKTGENLPGEIGTGGNARSAAIYMNRYVIVPSREGEPDVWVWDSHNPDDDPFALDPGDGYEGGLFLVNYVQTVGEYIYVSNMSLGSDEAHPFKIYRWDGLDASPEVFLSSGEGYGRMGDSFSIIGDPAGDGHIIAHVNSGGEGQRNFRKWNFVDGVNQNPDDPELITLEGTYNMNSYGVYNTIEGEEDFFLVTGNGMGIAIADLEGAVHAYLGTSIVSVRTMDPRIFYHDGNRYLSYVVNNEGDGVEGAYYDVIDISIGDDVIEAFENINTLDDLLARKVYSFTLGGGAAFLSATHAVSHTEGGNVMLLSHVVARGFILETTGLDDLEPMIVTFDVTDADGMPIDDAVITLGDVTNEAGDYVFTVTEAGTYAYTVSRLCYLDLTGEVVADSDMLVEVVLNLDILAGDANGDGVINILDIITIANYYTSNPVGDFCPYNADANGDGMINILDVLTIVNIIGDSKSVPYPGLKSDDAYIYMDDKGIDLHSDGTLAGIQFEIAGDLAGFELNLELVNHQIIYANDNSTLRAIIFSADNTPFPAGIINLVTFSREATPDWVSVMAGNLNAEEVPVIIRDDEVTGIDEAQDLSFNAYPNPASDVLYVDLNINKKATISLINMHGQLVDSKIVTESGQKLVSFNLSSLSAGLYMLRIDHEDTFFTERILIK